MLALKQSQHSLSRIMTDARFFKWADWILKDNQLLKKDGLDLNAKEMEEAIMERGIINPKELKLFVEKHSKIGALDSNRKVATVEQINSHGIVMALDQMHLNVIKQ